MKNHLFIGLGGQGGKTISAIKKVFATRANDGELLKQNDVNWDFLYIDSSRDIQNERNNWVHFGQNLTLPPSSFLYLKDGGEEIDASSLSLDPKISEWIGDVDRLQSFLDGTQGIQGANQRRRLGRLLFARNAERIKKAVCEDKIGKLTLQGGNTCAVHIFASLAGGTGSGSLIDLVTMIRQQLPSTNVNDGFPIFLYLYVTDEEHLDSQVGFFHENQAATLRDLNALACGKFQPHLLDRPGTRFSGEAPITQIMLSSSLSNKNQRIKLPQQHQIFAEAVFERIYSYASGHLEPGVQKALTGEDVLASFSGEPTRNSQRSFRFGSLGMSRWEVPIEEINEYLEKNLEVHTYNQLLYQNWTDNYGPQDSPLSNNIQGLGECYNSILAVLDRESLQKQTLEALNQKLSSDLHLYHTGKVKEGFKDLDLQSYRAELEHRYYGGLDQRGVDAVFASFASERQNRVQRVLAGMHEMIEQAWTRSNNRLGISYIGNLLTEVQNYITQQINASQQQTLPADTLKIRLERRSLEWAKMTLLSRPLKQADLAHAQMDDVAKLLRQDLGLRMAQEETETKDLIRRELGRLASQYTASADVLVKLRDEAKIHLGNRLQDLKDYTKSDDDGSHTGAKTSNKFEFSLDLLQFYANEYRLQRPELTNACDEVVTGVLQPTLGDANLIRLMKLQDQIDGLKSQVETVLYRRSKEIHDRISEAHHKPSILQGSVLDILEQRYKQNPDELQSTLRKFINNSSCNVQLRTSELQPKDLKSDRGMPSMPKTTMVVGLPRNHPFARTFAELVRAQMAAGSREVPGIYYHDDDTQIRLLSSYYWMAARFTQVVHKLEEIYSTSLSNDHQGDFKYFTNLDASGEAGKRPEMLLPSVQESKAVLRASLFLSHYLKHPTGEPLIQETANGVMLMEYDEAGMLAPSYLTETMEAMQHANINVITRVASMFQAHLGSLSEAQIQQLQNQLKAHDSEVLQQHGSASAEYFKWLEERKHITKLLTK